MAADYRVVLHLGRSDGIVKTYIKKAVKRLL